MLTLRFGVIKILFVGGVLAAATNFLFMILATVGPNIWLLKGVAAAGARDRPRRCRLRLRLHLRSRNRRLPLRSRRSLRVITSYSIHYTKLYDAPVLAGDDLAQRHQRQRNQKGDIDHGGDRKPDVGRHCDRDTADQPQRGEHRERKPVVV